MRVVADVPEYLVERVRQLVAKGTYGSLSSFVVASIESQLTLEESPLGVGYAATLGAQPGLVVPAVSMHQLAGLELPSDELPTLESPSRPEEMPVEQWPWGYMNRLLPVKFTVRLLANMVSSVEPSVPLDAFRVAAADAARVFGMWLMTNDDKQGHRRGERLSEGFPIGEAEEASLRRYGNNFVGYERKRDGALFGALFELKLANVERIHGKLSVGLTEEGLRCAQIANPVLDNSDLSSSLSGEEIEFYLDHIRAKVPGEVFAFQLSLKLIAEGVDTRQKLTKEVKSRVPLDWADSVAGIQVAGTTARMTELGLVDRDRHGQRVAYRISERGSNWLRRPSAQQIEMT